MLTKFVDPESIGVQGSRQYGFVGPSCIRLLYKYLYASMVDYELWSISRWTTPSLTEALTLGVSTTRIRSDSLGQVFDYPLSTKTLQLVPGVTSADGEHFGSGSDSRLDSRWSILNNDA